MSLFGSRCVCVCVIVNYPVYLNPVFWVPFHLVYSLFPVFLSVYLALSYLDVVIKDYYFEVSPRLRVPRFSLLCAPWQKTRPNSKHRPFTSFCFVRFFKSLVCSCVLSLAASGLMPAVRGSLRRRSRLSHPAVRWSSRRRSRLSDPAVRGSWCRHSRLSHPAVRGSSRRRSRINQPTVHRRWRHRPRLNLAHRPAAESMPAGLPLTQARRIAADSSPPDCRWLKPAGLPLTQACRIAADSCPLAAVGGESQLATSSVHAAVRGSPTLPFAGDHAAVRGENQPTVGGCL